MWSLIEKRHGRIPPSRVTDRDLGKTIVIRMDASIVIAHSGKQLAAGTYKGTWGHHPLQAWCDNTGESLALLLRKGSAGSSTATDHIEVPDEAITGIPARYRRDLLITVDGAGASHGLIDHITTLNSRPGYRVHYSIGWKLNARERKAIAQVPASAWGTVLDARGQPRDPGEAGLAELTALLREGPGGDQLASWPKDMRIIGRREKPHPGAQLSLFETAMAGATNSWPPAPLAGVYDATPEPRSPGDVISRPGQPRTGKTGPCARGKWLTASITDDIPAVIAAAFDEADRRDPGHRRPWIALVDGNTTQIDAIQTEATRRQVSVAIVLDFIHA